MTIKSSGNKKYSILAIIPARGGSKGIKDKNVRLVNGIPLICHTIRLLKSIKFIDNSIVSTDSKKIKNISIKNGIEVPFLRPKYLSGDNVADMPVLQHALKNCEANYKKKFDIILMLQPTSPMRKKDTIVSAIRKIIDENLEAVWSVSKVDSKFHPLKILKLKSKYLDYYLTDGSKIINRQMLDQVYQRNGLIYVFSRKTINSGVILPKKTGCVISKHPVINIDSFEELKNVARYL